MVSTICEPWERKKDETGPVPVTSIHPLCVFQPFKSLGLLEMLLKIER